MQRQRRRVRYYADDRCTAVDLEEGHVMRPIRVRLTHSLVHSLGLDEKMEIFEPPLASPQELLTVHSPAFIQFLQRSRDICADPDNPVYVDAQRLYGADCRSERRQIDVGNAEGDCPLFPDLWEVVSSSCGGSLAAARTINLGEADVVIHWAGGLHHAFPTACCGFCYANDIALCIHELLLKHRRVLYVDIDAHHGDGVEFAFATDPRVMTISIHQFGEGFFPGTGGFGNMGADPALGFAVNLPIPAHTEDDTYLMLLRVALLEAVAAFDPETCVLQCGADTIFGDPIGQLRISTRAFAEAARLVLDEIAIPTVILGGGGYNVPNTARAWSIISAVAVQSYETLPCEIPSCDPYFFPHYCRTDPVTFASDPEASIGIPSLHVSVPKIDRRRGAKSRRRQGAICHGASNAPVCVERNILSHIRRCMHLVRSFRWGLSPSVGGVHHYKPVDLSPKDFDVPEDALRIEDKVFQAAV